MERGQGRRKGRPLATFALWRLLAVVLALLLCACSQEVMGPHGRKPMLLSGTERPDRAPGSLLRADPGYIQWLERQSMLGNADDLAAEVSGSERLWGNSGSNDRLPLLLDDPQNFEDERLPYWTELWPSSIALCRWLEERRAEIAGRPCLDLGCGLGLTAMVGQWLGAQVIGMDYEEEALHFASLNARHNGVTSPLWTVMDWRQPAVRPRSIFRLWGGDIMYEKRFVAPVMHFLSHVLADDGAAWVAEPGRGVYEAFLQALHGGGLEGRRVFTERVEPLYAQPVPVTVAVWEIRRRVRPA